MNSVLIIISLLVQIIELLFFFLKLSSTSISLDTFIDTHTFLAITLKENKRGFSKRM